MARAYIGLGANIGDARAAFDIAVFKLEEATGSAASRSRLYRTRPWGVADQPDFLNAAVAIDSTAEPAALLDLLMQVEREAGRNRPAELHWGPRALDLDLLMYGGISAETARLTLPHPRIAGRDFVIAPLIDLAAPPPRSVAPLGWSALLDSIPAAARTIISPQSWE